MRIASASTSQFRLNFRSVQPVQQTYSRTAIKSSTAPQDLRTYHSLVRLRMALGQLEEKRGTFQPGGTSKLTIAAVTSSATALNLQSNIGDFAKLISTEEINTLPTSFTPRGPSFSGTSTAIPTIGGVYDGSQGEDSLTFTIVATQVGPLTITKSLTVTDGQGQTIDQFNLDDYQPDTELNLSNGLTLQLSSGTLTDGGSFGVDVFDSVGSVVNAYNPFDGTRNSNPGFEDGFVVTAGSFEINGETISVAASDSINGVIDKINQSAAGVTASFNSASEQIEVIQNSVGQIPTIEFSNDTSGFLAATKLSNATAVAGRDAIDELNDPLSSTSKFAAVQSGNISVNGVNIAIDVLNDSLADVLRRISESAAGVNASFSSADQRVYLQNVDRFATLSLADNGTGFIAAINVNELTVEPTVTTGSKRSSTKGLSQPVSKEFSKKFAEVIKRFNEVFDDSRLFESASDFTIQSRNEIQTAFGSFTRPGEKSPFAPFSIRVDFSATKGQSISFNNTDRSTLEQRLKKDPSAINELFFGSKSSKKSGMIEKLSATIKQLEKTFVLNGQPPGSYFDVLV